jgi:hypothetical protein
MTLATNSLKKWSKFIIINIIRNKSLIKTMMHLFHRVFKRLNINIKIRKNNKNNIKKFYNNIKRNSFNIIMRYCYIGKYKYLLKKNKMKIKNNTTNNSNNSSSSIIIYEINNTK